MSLATFAAAYAMKERMAPTLLKHSKVQGVGVGYHDPERPKKGAAVIIYADALSAVALGIASTVTISVKGKNVQVPIRVVRTGKIRSHANFQGRIRPVQAGYSIGTAAGSGTAGLIVTNFPGANQRYIFSNTHVLTNPLNSNVRAETLQPGGADNGRPVIDRVGSLSRYALLRRNATNFIDAAISLPVRNAIVTPRYATVGVVPGYVTSYRVGDRFKKVGRTTGLRFGRVDSVNTDVLVDYGGNLGVITFRNQSVIVGASPVSLPGDSGSVWLRRADNFAAAVNFAGTEDGLTSIAFPVDWFMRRFRLRVARPNGAGIVKNVKTNGNPAFARRLTARELASIRIISARSRTAAAKK